MGNIFAASEVVEIGIQIEKNGRDFYNTLFDNSNSVKAKEIYKYLAKEEERHIATFQKIFDSVEKYEPDEAYPVEYFAYMNALASGYVFTQKEKGEKIAKGVKSDKEAVEMGIGFEKDSIVFYEGMKRMVPEYDQKILHELIAQEESHLVQLTDLKKVL